MITYYYNNNIIRTPAATIALSTTCHSATKVKLAADPMRGST